MTCKVPEFRQPGIPQIDGVSHGLLHSLATLLLFNYSLPNSSDF